MQDDLMERISPDPLAKYRAAVANRFVSLWDMLQLQAKSFLSALTLLASTVGQFRSVLDSDELGSFTVTVPVSNRGEIFKALRIIRETCEQHELAISFASAVRCSAYCGEVLAASGQISVSDLIRMTSLIEGLIHSVVDETEGRKFYALRSRAASHHASVDDLFGREVVDAFPAAVFDLEEAGRCLAFELWTAAVMHLMRALEPALGALARHVDIEAGANWNQTLDQIEKQLRLVSKRNDGAEAEEWAAEAGAQLRFIKNAWRNSAMHGGATYDERRARSIFETTRSLMQHLAEKIEAA